ncbi:MAG TPA: GerMN domain-containing protein [Bacillota bacterium]|nr:GerMN domain-containing protein [Bacillota bacterium]
MKRFLTLAFLLLSLVFLVSCGSSGTKTDPDTDKKGNTSGATQSLRIEDFFPFEENIHYTYEGIGNEYAAYSVYVDYHSGSRLQQRVNNGGTEAAKVLELKDGKLIQVFSRGEVYFRENLLQAQGTAPEILLMEPLVKGTSWTLKDGRTRTITDLAADVTTPSGNYKAIQVDTQGPNDQITDYYARNVGLVKTVFSSGGTEVSSSLATVEKDVPFVQGVSFYYPNVNDNKLTEVVRNISFRTNDITGQKLEAAYKEPGPANTGKVFSANTTINRVYLNTNFVVSLDLNRAFLTEMNAGSGYEAMILQSLANTFGRYYGVDKVSLTIDNKPYESGHILLKPGEYLQVK